MRDTIKDTLQQVNNDNMFFIEWNLRRNTNRYSMIYYISVYDYKNVFYRVEAQWKVPAGRLGLRGAAPWDTDLRAGPRIGHSSLIWRIPRVESRAELYPSLGYSGFYIPRPDNVIEISEGNSDSEPGDVRDPYYTCSGRPGEIY